MSITFYFKPTKKGFYVYSDIFELSIYKGLIAWGKSKESAIKNLISKWNNKVKEDSEKANKDHPNISYKLYELTISKY